MATITTPAPAASLSIDEIKAATAQLSPEEREELIQRLIELEHPADPDVEAAWDEEISRRLEEVRGGNVQCLDGDEVMREIRERFGLSCNTDITLKPESNLRKHLDFTMKSILNLPTASILKFRERFV